MIVVDTNVIAYLLIPGDLTSAARALLKNDVEWAAPDLWRSEFLNVLATYINVAELPVEVAVQYFQEAELLFAGRRYPVSTEKVLNLVKTSGCSAYDCQFVALAQELGTGLVTSDKRLLRSFPEITKPLQEYS